ncbi:MAG TPA: pitrilysin family protein [Azospirillaceae bacterium]|nr:pitrilysin family protein [Azospirillaceae bacterium]
MSARHLMKRLAGTGAVLLLSAALAVPAMAVEIKRVVSPGGIEAWLVRDEKNPIISMSWAFDGGTELDPAGKLGLAHMTSGLLDEGAGDLESQAFQKRLEDNSISLSFSAARDGFFGGLTTLRDNRETAFDLARLAMTAPRFDQDAVERIRRQILTGLKRDQTDPNYIAQLTMMRALYPDHPYGKPARGTPETVAAITRDDLTGFVKARLGRDRLKVAVSGDITEQELGPVLDKVFGALPAKAEPFTVPDVAPAAKGQVLAVPVPIPQTIMSMAQRGLKREDPNWYAASLLNYVLGGGGFSSRLMDEVREKRGLTYGVGTGLQPYKRSAVMTAGGSTMNEKAGQALDLIKEIWGRVAREGITAQELQDAKTYLTGSFPLQLTSNGAIAGVLLQLQRDNLGIDFLERRNELLNQVTLEQVNALAKDLLDPKNLLTVVVGQPQGVTPTETVPPPTAVAKPG